MNAMILAAGFGTRFKPVTDHIPKALIPVAEKPLLSIVLDRLAAAHCNMVVINTHHLADQIIDFLASHKWPDLAIKVSHEEQLLDTGGGLVRMLDFLPYNEPVLVHNVDVLTDLDFSLLLNHHLTHNSLVTLAVQKRKTKRYLLFDRNMHLCGRLENEQQQNASGLWQYYAFNGIHIFDPKALCNAPSPPFSSIDHYIHLAQHGESVIGFPMDSNYWRDIGRHSDLLQAEKDIRLAKIIV